MFVLSNLILAVATVFNIGLTIYMWIIIITEPVLWRVRRMILPFGGGIGIDFSPIIVILVIYFLKLFLVQTLIQLAQQLK